MQRFRVNIHIFKKCLLSNLKVPHILSSIIWGREQCSHRHWEEGDQCVNTSFLWVTMVPSVTLCQFCGGIAPLFLRCQATCTAPFCLPLDQLWFWHHSLVLVKTFSPARTPSNVNCGFNKRTLYYVFSSEYVIVIYSLLPPLFTAGARSAASYLESSRKS